MRLKKPQEHNAQLSKETGAWAAESKFHIPFSQRISL